MDRLSNDILLEAYEKAKELQLEEDFVELLYKELHRRLVYQKLEIC